MTDPTPAPEGDQPIPPPYAPPPYGAPNPPPAPSPAAPSPAAPSPPAPSPYGAASPPPYGYPPQGQVPHTQPYAPGQPGYPPQGQVPHTQPYAPGQPGYPAPAYGYAAAVDHPKATHALIWGLVAVVGGFLCGLPLLVSPVAWIIGARTRREIDARPGLGGRGQATAGMVLGIVGSVLLLLGIALVVLLVVVGISGGFEGETTFGNAGGSLQR